FAVERDPVARSLLAIDLREHARLRDLIDAERGEHLAQKVVRRQLAVLERVEVRLDLRLHEAADHRAKCPMLLAPFDHGADSSRLWRAPARRVPGISVA